LKRWVLYVPVTTLTKEVLRSPFSLNHNPLRVLIILRRFGLKSEISN
jgi:hypothetical protein